MAIILQRPDPAPVLRLQTLGGLSIQADDRTSLATIQRRRLALLALLARCGDRAITRDKILGYLWPESEPEKARNVLAQALYALRRDLGAEQLFLGTTELRLNPEVLTSDAAEFEAALGGGQLERAVGLYRGPFLDGFYINEAPEFERWVENQRADLAQAFVGTLERLAKGAASRGDHQETVGWWRRLAAADPLSARVAINYMEALARAGDRGAAIQHARVYAELLRQELDAEPDPEVLELAERLRREPPAPTLRAPAAPVSKDIPDLTAAQAPTPVPVGDSPPPATVSKDRRPRVLPLVLLAAAVFLLIGLGLAGRRFMSSAGDVDSPRMVAVLPFQNLGRPDDEYFADGLTEEVTSRLAGIRGLRVISRTSSMQYKRSNKSLRQIGEELGAAYILEGSVRWEHLPEGTSRVRVTPQLIQVSDDSHLWADRYEADLADVFRVQGDIAERVAAALDVTLGEPERRALTARPTGNTQAYDFYLRGNDYFARAWGSEANLRIALEMYEKAVTLDSTFALAHARLSRCHAQMFWHYYDRSPKRLDQAKASAEAALRLEPALPEGHEALGYYHYWGRRDYGQALREFGLAERQGGSNNSDLALAMGAVARRQGKWDEAVTGLARAADLDPRSSTKAWEVGVAHFYLRNYAEAERSFDRALAIAPDMALAWAFQAQLYLSWKGDTSRTRQLLQRATRTTSLGPLLGFLGSARHLVVGDPDYRSSIEALTANDFGNDTTYFYIFRAETFRDWGLGELQRRYADSARARLEPAVREMPNDDGLRVALAFAYNLLGRGQDAIREARKAVEVLPVSLDAYWGPDRHHELAEVYVRAGEHEAAIDELAYLLSIPSNLSAAQLRVVPTWDPLRANPRFQRLLLSP